MRVAAITAALLVLLLAVGTNLALASNHLFQTGSLRGANEVPAVDTDARGKAMFRVIEDGNRMQAVVLLSNIEDVVASHIHCAAASVNGPVAVTLFAGGPVSFEGQGVLTRTAIRAPDSENGCGWESISDAVAAMGDGGAYVNVHTVGNPGGEVRGQIASLFP